MIKIKKRVTIKDRYINLIKFNRNINLISCGVFFLLGMMEINISHKGFLVLSILTIITAVMYGMILSKHKEEENE